MSYGTIVNELARLLDIPIIAYDNISHRGGCILYLDGPVRRIDIDTAALDQGAEELAAFILQVMASAQGSVGRIKIGLLDGNLAIV